MQIAVLGVNYKSCPIEIREKIAAVSKKRLDDQSWIASQFSCVVLSTCHRTEIYFAAENLADAHSEILHLLREELSFCFEHHLYSYFGGDCFLHLGRVVSGLDSVILAESEIKRQVKIAYQTAQLNYPLKSSIHFLFQKALKLGKEIRSKMDFKSEMTIGKMLFEISLCQIQNLKDASFLFIGNSEVNRQIIAHFKQKGIHHLSLCTRSLDLAKELAKEKGISLLPWEERNRWLDFSVVICGSNAPEYVINPMTHAVKTKIIFDLSVPRNVNPLLKRHPLLTLFNMEEISHFLDQYQFKNNWKIIEAEEVITSQVQKYLLFFRKKLYLNQLKNRHLNKSKILNMQQPSNYRSSNGEQERWQVELKPKRETLRELELEFSDSLSI